MPARTSTSARKAADIVTELVRHRAVCAPSILAKTLFARGFYGIEVSRFLMSGLYAQRMRQWRESLGYLQELEPGLRTLNWQGDGKRLTVDKLIMAERLAASGLPMPRLIGVIGRDEAAHSHGNRFPSLRSRHDVDAALTAAPDRLFVKPATGWRGDGIFGPERRDGAWRLGNVSLTNGELAERLLAAAPASGLLVQERICSHPALAPIGGHLGLGTVRINTALTVDGPEVIFVFGKIMGAEGLVDNFAGGKFGNLLARIDPDSGRILRAFGRHPDQQYLMESVTHHPVTGTALEGFQMPLWPEAIALARSAAIAFHEAPLLGADVALTEAGPVIIEMQSDWDANAPQLLLNQGLRPLLRRVVPRLAAPPEVRERAFQQMRLGEPARRRARVLREARA